MVAAESAKSVGDDSTAAAKSKRHLRLLFAMACLYLIWLAWLLYVGIVNNQAGNQ